MLIVRLFVIVPTFQLPDPPEIVAVLVCATVILSVLPLYDNALKGDDRCRR